MSAKDIFHEVVKRALQKDGWQITHDPLSISVGGVNISIDLGAERLIAAGVPKEDIVWGFQPPFMRQFTEYAVG